MGKITIDLGVLFEKVKLAAQIIESSEIPAGMTIGLKDGTILSGTRAKQ
jgi:hypothetical protein